MHRLRWNRQNIVVNMVDPGPTLLALSNAATGRKKSVLFPLNIAFGGVVLAFGPDSPSVDGLFGTK